MSAVLENGKQSMAGYQIGASAGTKFLVTILSLALVGYNAVHLHDYAVVMFVNADTWLIKEYAIRAAAVGLAFVEIIVGGVFVYLYRTNDKITAPLLIVGFLALVVASMAVVAGNGSQQSKADVKSNYVNAHRSNLAAIQNRMDSAAAERDISLRLANQIKDPNQRAIEKDRANLEYSNRVARLNNQKSGMQSNKPVQPIENGSIMHYVSITLFSVLCSFGALFLSGYSAAFLRPLVAIPAFTLVRKLQHAWQSDGSDFQTTKHSVSPIGGVLGGLIGTQKLTKSTPSPSSESHNLTGDEKRAAENRPEPEDTRPGAVLKEADLVGERPPNKTGERAALVDYSESHYEAIKQAIVKGDISPTQKPVKSQLVKLNVRFVDDAARQKKAVEILDALAVESVLVVNPDFGKGGQVVARYLLNSKFDATQEDSEESADSNQVGEFDITTRCGSCGEYAYTKIDELLGKQKGIVSCQGCGKKYVAQSHLTSDSNPLSEDLKARAIQSHNVS